MGHPVYSRIQSLKYQKPVASDCKDIGMRKLEFGVSVQIGLSPKTNSFKILDI